MTAEQKADLYRYYTKACAEHRPDVAHAILVILDYLNGTHLSKGEY